MTALDSALRELADVERLLAHYGPTALEEWSAAWVTRQSLLQRQVDLQREVELLSGRAEFEVRLIGGAEREHGVDASFLGDVLTNLQGAIRAGVAAMMRGEAARGPYPGAAIAASQLRLAGTTAGSMVLLLGGPVRQVQITLDGTSELPPFDHVVGDLMDVVDAASVDQAQPLEAAIGALGSHRANEFIKKLADGLADTGTAASLIQRSPFVTETRESMLAAASAQRLASTLSRTEQLTEEVWMTGLLEGLRWGKQDFELLVAAQQNEEVVSGSVSTEIRDQANALFYQNVRARLERTIRRSPIEDIETVSYRLVGVEPLGADREQSGDKVL